MILHLEGVCEASTEFAHSLIQLLCTDTIPAPSQQNSISPPATMQTDSTLSMTNATSLSLHHHDEILYGDNDAALLPWDPNENDTTGNDYFLSPPPLISSQLSKGTTNNQFASFGLQQAENSKSVSCTSNFDNVHVNDDNNNDDDDDTMIVKKSQALLLPPTPPSPLFVKNKRGVDKKRGGGVSKKQQPQTKTTRRRSNHRNVVLSQSIPPSIIVDTSGTERVAPYLVEHLSVSIDTHGCSNSNRNDLLHYGIPLFVHKGSFKNHTQLRFQVRLVYTNDNGTETRFLVVDSQTGLAHVLSTPSAAAVRYLLLTEAAAAAGVNHTSPTTSKHADPTTTKQQRVCNGWMSLHYETTNGSLQPLVCCFTDKKNGVKSWGSTWIHNKVTTSIRNLSDHTEYTPRYWSNASSPPQFIISSDLMSLQLVQTPNNHETRTAGVTMNSNRQMAADLSQPISNTFYS